MSFEIFLQCFVGGEPAGIPRAAIRPLFPVVEGESEPDRWSIRYDDRNTSELYLGPLGSDAALVTSITVSRPCKDARLWEAFLATMRLGSVTLYFPGGPPLVASAAAGKQLPPEIVEALGHPRVVASAQEIVDALEGPEETGPVKPQLYRDLIDSLVDMCHHGQGQIGARRAREGVWNENATTDLLPDQHEINLFLARLSGTDREILAKMLAHEVVTGVFETLKSLEEFGVEPFETGYEGSPFNDFIGRLDDWEWPER